VRIKALFLSLLLLAPCAARSDDSVLLRVDFARDQGLLRPLHGINKGPLAPGGLIDLSEGHRQLAIPFTRLHDCHWPNPNVVDIHAIFPDLNADPERAESYRFAFTDEYLAAIKGTGAQIVYRLGQSIEHTTIKRFVHPPPDPEQWAAICLGIIRHYNEGWADGFRYNIRYWEIWNEPENRPAMWTGTDEDYFRLYRAAARAIKNRYPELNVGGPSVGASGHFVDGEFRPSNFVTAFLEFCRREQLPLDFFSWHCYTADPSELAARAKAIRRLLDAHGFTRTESHLNEWNYLPGNTWAPLSRSSPADVRQRFYEAMAGAPGAAFIATALIELQDAPVDMANLFHGELGPFGIFNEHGVPAKNFHALRAFRELLRTPHRVETSGGISGKLALAAGLNQQRQRASILISNFGHSAEQIRIAVSNLPWSGGTMGEVFQVNATCDFAQTQQLVMTEGSVRVNLKAPGVALVTLREQ
jgi:xylan 1,4-beta-xylosidase